MSGALAAVVGLGVSGQAAAHLLADRGYQVVVYDQVAADLPPELRDKKVDLVTIGSSEGIGSALVDLQPITVVLSPGVPHSSPLVQSALSAGLDVISEVELAWRMSQERESKARWLAITGTNGKTTTVGMTDSILRAGHLRSIQTGNVGYPVTKAAVEDHDILVVELSSFQLAGISTVAPWASICLNVDRDHLDWHGSIEGYRAAKARVYDRTIRARFVFADDADVMSMARNAIGAQGSMLIPLTFGSVAEGEVGIVGGKLVDRAFRTSESLDRADLTSVPLLAGPARIDDARSPLLRDALAASALALSVGATAEDIETGLINFRSAPHRFALVSDGGGKNWIDDSKATNEHAAAAALANVSPGRCVWIVGGDAKGQDLDDLIARASATIRGAVVIGADQAPILEAFARAGSTVPVVPVPGHGEPREWMDEVVRACDAMSTAGDTVLLAPACASWDQFDSYSQRGEIFQEAVRRVLRER